HPALPRQAAGGLGHRHGPQGRPVRQARRVIDLQPAVAPHLPRAGDRPQLDEGVPEEHPRGHPAPARLAPVLRGAGSRPGCEHERDRHRAPPPARGRVEIPGAGPDPGGHLRSDLRLVPADLLAQAAPALRRDRHGARAARRGRRRRHRLSPIPAPHAGLRALHPAHGLPAPAVPRHAARDTRIRPRRLRPRLRAGRAGKGRDRGAPPPASMSPPMSRRVLVVVGTRPEAIKMAPVMKALGACPELATRVALTGQHGDLADQALEAFDTPAHYDLAIMKPDQSLYDVVGGVLEGLRRVVADFRPDVVLVQGDTATAFTASLVAFFERVKVGHIEAGLRSGEDRGTPFPEEMFRRLTDVLADYYFAPTVG